MIWKKTLLIILITTTVSTCVQAAPSDFVSPNVPLSSPLYSYIEKFDGLGYLKSIPDGTKPYTRMQMAKWLTEIQSGSEGHTLPGYLGGMKAELERELAVELNVLLGHASNTSLGLKEFRLEVSHYRGNQMRYRMNPNPGRNSGPHAEFQPLNNNNNGYRYGESTNLVGSLFLAGKLADDWAIALEPRFSYDGDQHGDVALTSGYVKTRISGIGVQLGKDPVSWGHGTTGSLILGNNMTPFTSIQLSNLEPYTSKGFLKFLGDMNFTVLYSELESNRTYIDQYGGKQEVNSPSFVGVRATFTPQKNFTFGATLTSMLGGKGRGLSGSQYLDWMLGRNDEVEDDKWNNIAGLDFKLRIPKWNGVQFYGELYGEDQANYLPSKIGEVVGVYLPKLSRDGAWDMKLEYAHTSNWWYEHQLYTKGYVYKGDIIGHSLGHNASQYYVQIGHYLNKDSKISFNGSYLSQDRDAAVQQGVKSLWLQYETKLRDRMFLDGQVGIARIDNANFSRGNRENNHFAGVNVRWVY